MENLTIVEIVETWLKKNGFDGLYSEDCCACEVSDLMPCDNPDPNCKAGYKHTYKECENCGCGKSCDYHIGPEKLDN